MTSSEKRKEVLQAFDAPEFSEQQAFVIEQLDKLNTADDISQKYFDDVIKGVYGISDRPIWNCEDEPDFIYSEPLSFENWVKKYIENIILRVFDKKIDLNSILNN